MTHPPLRPLTALATVVLGLVLAGCGSSGDGSATTADTGPAITGAGAATTGASRATTASTGGGAPTSAVSTEDTSAAIDGTLIEATVAGGKVTVAEDRFEVAEGTYVVIRVTVDAEEPVHLHGYDIEADALPGKPAEIAFTADIPGVFEVELEDSGTLLFEIEVK